MIEGFDKERERQTDKKEQNNRIEQIKRNTEIDKQLKERRE